MKIGNNSITGIFKYTPTCKPEVGDFVLHDGYLWICKVTSPLHSPSTNWPEEWRLYQSPDIATQSEVINTVLNTSTEWPEKAIRLSDLEVVLDSVYHGLTGRGIIKDSEVSIESIVTDQRHPYGIYAFDRKSPELTGLVDTNGSTPVFLKKYTYTTKGVQTILLELSDYQDGTLWYKQVTPETPSQWKVVSPAKSMKSLIETLVGQYRSRLRALENIESSIHQAFRHTQLTFPEGLEKEIILSSDLTESVGTPESLPVLSKGTEYDYTVVILFENTETGKWISESLTVPGSESREFSVPSVALPGPATLGVSVVPGEKLCFSLYNIPKGFTGRIRSIHYQDFYE